MQVNKEALPQPYLLTIVEDDLKYIKEEKEKCWHDFKKKQAALITKSVPGFRAESVPRSMGEKKFELGQIYESLLNSILNKGLLQCGLTVVSVLSNKVELGNNDGPIMIVTEVDLAPSVELGQYKDLSIQYEPVKIKDQEVEAVLQRIRESSAVEEKVDRPVEVNDTVLVEFVGKIDGVEFEGGSTRKSDGTQNPLSLTIGSGKFVKGFEEQLIGVKIGEVRIVKIVFPENYHKQEYRSKEAVFEVTVKSITVKILPELNDDFAKKNGYANLIDAKDKLKEDLISNKKYQNEMIIEDKVLMELIKSCKVSPIPRKILQEQLDSEFYRLLNRMNLDEKTYFEKTRSNREAFDRQYKQMVERDVKVRYILETIASQENIDVVGDELQAILKSEAEKRKLAIEQLDANVIRKNNIVHKTLEFIKKSAKVETVVQQAPAVREVILEE